MSNLQKAIQFLQAEDGAGDVNTPGQSLSISLYSHQIPSQSELDEMAHEAAMSEEMAMKAMMDAARLAEELRTEQEVAMATERDRKLLEAQVKDLVARCDEAETNALKVCKQHMTKNSFDCDMDFYSGRKKSCHQNGIKDQRA